MALRLDRESEKVDTVKPFYLADLKVSDFTCKFILAPFILANSYYTIFMPIKVGILAIFAPFNFTVLFSSRNKGHANFKDDMHRFFTNLITSSY